MKLPLNIIIPPGAESVLEWTEEHALQIHRSAVQAAKMQYRDPDTDEVAMIRFYEHSNGRFPHSEIYIDRANISEALQRAEEYFVDEELYEEAGEAKNFREHFEYKQQ